MDFQDEVITLYGDLEYLKRTTMIQVIVFFTLSAKKLFEWNYSFHAAAVLYRDTLILFMGLKALEKRAFPIIFHKNMRILG